MGNKKIILYIALYILALGGMAGAGYYFSLTFSKMRVTHAAGAEDKAKEPTGFYDLPVMSLNLPPSSGKVGTVKIGISIEVSKKDLARIADYQPRIMDRIIAFMQKLSYDDLKEIPTSPRTREALIDEISNVSGPIKIFSIMIRQFLMD